MGDAKNDLAALIGSRICHDLISPVGAIQNGLELLEMSGVPKGPEMTLIADSVGNAGARIQFFRIAFGASSDHPLGRSEIVSVLKDMGKNARVAVHWDPMENLPRDQVRLAFLAILCFETALPYGGTVRVVHDDGGWTITGSGEKLNVNAELWDLLGAGPGSPAAGAGTVTPAQVQFLLLPLAASELGRTIGQERDLSTLRLRF
ncbi:histidine phosphotransferase family protein [Chachezhania sediminis]|uniref:histidine phosphotransferase family protein n=1 Tax=Chachezhania sediminis TaxID=2599291 RepID=UPI00131C8EE8|nr:histidine phosphotransferase family protein [Chachezhania sediminis]